MFSIFGLALAIGLCETISLYLTEIDETFLNGSNSTALFIERSNSTNQFKPTLLEKLKPRPGFKFQPGKFNQTALSGRKIRRKSRSKQQRKSLKNRGLKQKSSNTRLSNGHLNYYHLDYFYGYPYDMNYEYGDYPYDMNYQYGNYPFNSDYYYNDYYY